MDVTIEYLHALYCNLDNVLKSCAGFTFIIEIFRSVFYYPLDGYTFNYTLKDKKILFLWLNSETRQPIDAIE